MGAAESTGRPNGTIEREEEGGNFMEKAATAATLAAIVAVTAWAISRILAAIVAVTAWAISRILSDNTKSDGGIISQDDGGGSDVAKQLITWSPPPRDQFKMNTDGACKPHRGDLAGYGGILRNDRGDFVCCFYGFIGFTNSLTAELRGILEGLKILERRGYMGSILETDNQGAYQFVKGGRIKKNVTDECKDMIRQCVKLIGDNNITVKLIRKHCNKCADKLADMAIKVQDDVELKYRDVIPPEIMSFIDEDKRLMGW